MSRLAICLRRLGSYLSRAPTERETLGAILILGLAFVFIFHSLNHALEPWVDEYFSLFMARHDGSLLHAVSRWHEDVLPPAYYFTLWLSDPLFGSSAESARWTNIAFLIISISVMCRLARGNRRIAGFLSTLLILSFGSYSLLRSTIELRPYTDIFSANLLMICSLFAISTIERDYDGKMDKEKLLYIVLGAAWSINLHYVSSIITGCVCGSMTLWLWASDRRRWAVCLAMSTIAAYVPLGIWYIAQHAIMARISANFWVATTTPQAIWFIVSASIVSAANIIILFYAIRRILVDASRSRVLISEDVRFALVVALGLILALALLLALNARQPFLLKRYLTASDALSLGVLAAPAYPVVMATRWRLSIASLMALVLICHHRHIYDRMSDWHRAPAKIAAIQNACPDTAVHARNFWDIDPTGKKLVASEPQMLRGVYEQLARTHGIRLEPESSRRISAVCPTIIWAGHVDPDKAAISFTGDGLPFDKNAFERRRLYKADNSFIAVVPPPKPVVLDR